MMLRLELPQVNVLSKIDLIERCGDLGKYGRKYTCMRILVPIYACVVIVLTLCRLSFCWDAVAAFSMSFFTQAMDLHRLLPFVNQHLTGSKATSSADSRLI